MMHINSNNNELEEESEYFNDDIADNLQLYHNNESNQTPLSLA